MTVPSEQPDTTIIASVYVEVIGGATAKAHPVAVPVFERSAAVKPVTGSEKVAETKKDELCVRLLDTPRVAPGGVVSLAAQAVPIGPAKARKAKAEIDKVRVRSLLLRSDHMN